MLYANIEIYSKNKCLFFKFVFCLNFLFSFVSAAYDG